MIPTPTSPAKKGQDLYVRENKRGKEKAGGKMNEEEEKKRKNK